MFQHSDSYNTWNIHYVFLLSHEKLSGGTWASRTGKLHVVQRLAVGAHKQALGNAEQQKRGKGVVGGLQISAREGGEDYRIKTFGKNGGYSSLRRYIAKFHARSHRRGI